MFSGDYSDQCATTGLVTFLFGIFCAYWAQTTTRSSWLWFFLGFLGGPITGLVLLVKNAGDPRTDRPA
jgi:hypothetical protein